MSKSVVQNFLGHSIAASAAAGDDDEFDFEPAAQPVKGLVQSAQQRALERKKIERQQVCGCWGSFA